MIIQQIKLCHISDLGHWKCSCIPHFFIPTYLATLSGTYCALRHLGLPSFNALLFWSVISCGCVGHLIWRRGHYQVSVWIVALSSQDRKEGRKRVEGWGAESAVASGLVTWWSPECFPEWLHLGVFLMCSQHPGFTAAKAVKLGQGSKNMARAQACEDASSSDFKWISPLNARWESRRPQSCCTICGMTKGSLDTRAEAQPRCRQG